MIFDVKKWLKYAEQYEDDKAFKQMMGEDKQKYITYKKEPYVLSKADLLLVYTMYQLATDDYRMSELSLFYVLPDELKVAYNYLLIHKYGLLNDVVLFEALAKLEAGDLAEVLWQFREMNKIVYSTVDKT